MNVPMLLKAFDAALALGDAVLRLKKGGQPAAQAPTQMAAQGDALGGQLEARLTNVVVAALKEAFDRDHARMEFERARMEEERRRADEALERERRRQAIQGEQARVRLLAGAALAGWIASVAFFAGRLDLASSVSRGMLAGGWLLLIAACGAAFAAERHLSSSLLDGRSPDTGWSGAALGLLVGGLALATVSLLF